MLKTRIITAIVLLAVLLPCLFYSPPLIWGGVSAVVAALAAWEWGGFMRLGMRERFFLGLSLAVLCFVLLLFFPQWISSDDRIPFSALFLHVPAVFFWFLVVPLWLRFKWPLPQGAAGLLVGLLVLLPTWAALVQLRALGAWSLLAMLAVMWVADSMAYFFGRLCGRRKLALNISPGKTWEGAWGAVASVVLYGLAMRELFELQHTPVLLWLMILPVMTGLSIVGDLFESLLKRQAGLKDSSQVLPGHGGILDRIDSLTSTLPFLALIFTLRGTS